MGPEERVREYWTRRAHDFGLVRRNELRDAISGLWLEELERRLPAGRSLDILDAGTGTGYFAVLLAARGHRLTGIDLTPDMLEEARTCAGEMGVNARFLLMDAQAVDFPDGSFDALVTRNLTWTLPDPAAAYREWHRLLRPGGVLLNFDADYAENVRRHNQAATYTDLKGVYGHVGVTPELSRMNAEITLSMPASRHRRPEWDLELLRRAGFREASADLTAGRRILGERDLPESPLFLLRAVR
jgi:SAM-dependent methyltransferase